MTRKPYQKPHIQQHDLSETPKLWRLLRAALDVQSAHPHFLEEVLGLAYYAARLALGRQEVGGPMSPELASAPPADPDHVDFGVGGMLTDRAARLADINNVAARALGLIRGSLYAEATRAVEQKRIELGQKVLDRRGGAGVGSGQSI